MNEPSQAAAFNAKENAFLQQLKAATDWHHRHLESQPLLQSLLLPEVTVEQYYRYLHLMQEIAKAYETIVLPLLSAWLPWLAEQPASQLIEQDLEDLRPLVANTPGLQPYFIDGSKMSLPFAWGFAYVMEGSKLGGRVIFKHIKKALKHDNEDGDRYLAGKGVDTLKQWKEFLQQLSSYEATGECGEEIIQGAIFSFTSIYQFFEVNKLLHED